MKKFVAGIAVGVVGFLFAQFAYDMLEERADWLDMLESIESDDEDYPVIMPV